MDRKIKDITVEILKAIRDEIKQLREDTNRRFEQMDKRFEEMGARLGHIETDIKAIVAHFDRDYMLLANKFQASWKENLPPMREVMDKPSLFSVL